MILTLTSDLAADAAPAGYAVISPAILNRLDRWDIDLFVLPKAARVPVLLREANLKIGEIRSQRLATNSGLTILIRQGTFDQLSTELLAEIDTLVTDDTLPARDRFAMLQFAAATEVEHACKLVNPGRFVDLAGKLGSGITKLLENDHMAPEELFQIARHDYHTFTHVTNVACYAVMLAESLGIADSEELRQIAIGGFLHDIGKRHIPGEILRKPARLTDQERQIVECHPQLGYEELATRDDLTHAQLMMVYQHHEWVNGGGYPVGILADEAHPWAQLLAVVDVFDAMTGQRPYRKPASPEFVISHLEAKSGEQFNQEIVRCWASTLEQR